MQILRDCKAMLFDFDGTLADSYGAIAASVNHVRATRGLPPLTVDEVKVHVGRGPDYLLANTIPGGDVDADITTYRAHHPSIMASLTTLLPGSLSVLETAKLHDKRIGLCSNKPRVFSRELLRHLDIHDYFHLVIGPEDVPNAKPAPDMLHKALRDLDLSPTEVLYVGDMTVDIETARAAGVTVWIVATGSDSREALEQAKPDRLLENMEELATMMASGGR